jgi:cytochrome c5
VWAGAGLALSLALSLAGVLLVAANVRATEDSVVAAQQVNVVYPRRLPEGAGRDLAEQRCLVCHSATLMTQQAKDSTAWAKSVKQMEDWGVVLTPAERDTLVGYLSGRLGPRPSTGQSSKP